MFNKNMIFSRIQNIKSTPLFLIFTFLGGFLTFAFFIVNLRVYGNYNRLISYTIYCFSFICFILASFFNQHKAEIYPTSSFSLIVLRIL